MASLDEINRIAELRHRLPGPSERRRVREEAGMSLDILGRAVGVTSQTVMLWERGATPRLENLEAYVEVLDALRPLGSLGASRYEAPEHVRAATGGPA